VNGKVDPRLPSSIELITKVGTVSVAVLYVLGLLVTNIHLMELGIADFSALQGRFVLSGALFLFYGLLLFALPAALIVVPLVAYKRLLKSVSPLWRLAMMLPFLVSWAWVVLELYGSILGDLYPWGSSYEEQWAIAFKVRAVFAATPELFHLVQDSFQHAKTLAAVGLAYLLGFWVYLAHKSKPDRAFVGLFVFVGLVPMILTLFGYAQSVYPNLPHNLGGGQPRIVLLHVRQADSLLLPRSGLAALEAQGGPLVSVPLALWHQDGSFLYVTPATVQEVGSSPLIAITTGPVEVVEYLGGWVKVTSDSRIEVAHVVKVRHRPPVVP
jgi:hypothetical protein